MDQMMSDLLLQAAIILCVIFMFLFMHNIPQTYFSKLRSSFQNKSHLQARRHFIQGAQLLSQAQAQYSKHQPTSHSLAQSAIDFADKAISLDPKDAATHILKALALELQGFKTSALDSIDIALSPLAVKSLEDQERGDALFKRAELRLAVSRRGRVDSVVGDLVESVRLKKGNVKAFCLLGECYEKKGMKEDARRAYENAVEVQPKCQVAIEGLGRLGS